ncbi:TldD/PmbA family protein [Micromonospora sp. NPDC003197]
MSRYGAERLFDLAAPVLRVDGADGIEVVLTRDRTALTRFADSRIHQNTDRSDGQARVRVVRDGPGGIRVGVASTNLLTPDGLREAARQATAIAEATRPDPYFGGLAAGGLAYPKAGRDHDGTADCPPQRRADIVRSLLSGLSVGVAGAGVVETTGSEVAVVNSHGVRAYHVGTRAMINMLATGADSAGYAEGVASALDDLDPVVLARRADDKVRLGARPREVPPGSYPVVLEPGATVVLLHRLAQAFAGRTVRDGSSPLAGRAGQRVCAPSVTLVDDPLSPLLPGLPFDAEGVPRRRTTLIERGVAGELTYDAATARAAGTTPTGHALLPPNPLSGQPTHLVMDSGDAEPAELVSGVERGLYITRFHYTNLVHPMRSTVTGTTRDGTFLIEDGRIVGGVRNLRFTQSVLAALDAVEAVGRDGEVAYERFFGDAYAPSLRLSSFQFTSTSTH